MGDVRSRETLKQKLQCKPFQYFVDRFRSVFDMKNMLPARHFAIKDEISGKCLEGHKDGTIRLAKCDNAVGPNFRSGFRFIPDSPSADKPGAGVLRQMKFSNLCFDANAVSQDKKGVQVLLYHCMNKNPNQKDWVIENGGLRWNNNCAYLENTSNRLLFGECTSKEGEFLGKRFYGHPSHRFVITDEQKLDAIMSDRDNNQSTTADSSE
jgi:hypothetical protein